MKKNPLILPLLGGGICLLCFFFPWIKYDFSSLDPEIMTPNLHYTETIWGIQLVINGATFEILNFLATLVILGVCLYMLKQKTPRKSRIPVLICSGFGILYYLFSQILFVMHRHLFSSKIAGNIQSEVDIGNIVSLQFGIYGVFV